MCVKPADMAKISVCIPTIGSNPYLPEAVESVRCAWLEDMELIILDNNSPTPVPESMLRPFGSAARIVRTGEKLPMALNWNRCFEVAQGEWVHILHDDDLVSTDFYSCFRDSVASAVVPKFGIWFCSTLNRMAQDPQRDYSSICPGGVIGDPDVLADLIFGKSLTRCAGTVIRRDVGLQLGGFDSHFKHIVDVEFFFRCARSAGAKFEPRILAIYRIHPGAMTGHSVESKIQPILEDDRLLTDLGLLLKKHGGGGLAPDGLLAYAHTVLWGAFRYYLRRARLDKLLLWLSCWRTLRGSSRAVSKTAA
jgi:GT2 family glycosyltransferase